MALGRMALLLRVARRQPLAHRTRQNKCKGLAFKMCANQLAIVVYLLAEARHEHIFLCNDMAAGCIGLCVT